MRIEVFLVGPEGFFNICFAWFHSWVAFFFTLAEITELNFRLRYFYYFDFYPVHALCEIGLNPRYNTRFKSKMADTEQKSLSMVGVNT